MYPGHEPPVKRSEFVAWLVRVMQPAPPAAPNAPREVTMPAGERSIAAQHSAGNPRSRTEGSAGDGKAAAGDNRCNSCADKLGDD